MRRNRILGRFDSGLRSFPFRPQAFTNLVIEALQKFRDMRAAVPCFGCHNVIGAHQGGPKHKKPVLPVLGRIYLGSLKQRCHGCARVTGRLEHSARKKERLRALTGLVPTPRAECEALIDAPVQRIRVRKAARRYGLGKEAHDIRVRWLDSYRQEPKREASLRWRAPRHPNAPTDRKARGQRVMKRGESHRVRSGPEESSGAKASRRLLPRRVSSLQGYKVRRTPAHDGDASRRLQSERRKDRESLR